MRGERWRGVRWSLVVVLLAVAGTVEGQEPHKHLQAFYPTGEYDLIVGQAKVDAKLLFSQRAAAYLLQPAGDERAYLLLQRKRTIATVPTTWIRHENGDVSLPSTTEPDAVGRLALKGEEILLEAPTLKARLRPRPPLTGYHRAEAVLDHAPQYGLVMRGYSPDKRVLAGLKDASEVKVEVIFGSWCPRCQQTIGFTLRVEQDLAAKGVSFVYYGLPKPPEAWKDPRFLESKAKALPTALVFKGDKLAGLIAPTEWNRFEAALARIVTP